MANLILSCACGWKAFQNECVPGTQLIWEHFTSRSLIFSSGNTYIFPFTLIWGTDNQQDQELKNFVNSYVCKAVPNLELNDLFLSYDRLCGAEPRTLGTLFEKLFASGLAAKYYIYTQASKKTGSVNLSSLLPFRGGKAVDNLLSQATVDFSQGISLPKQGATVLNLPTDNAVILNTEKSTAHHDLILPTSIGPVPVQAKASFDISNPPVFQSQLLVDKGQEVEALIWLYLGHKNQEVKYPKVVYVSAKEVCNSHEVDLLEYAKHLKSTNNKRRT